MAPTRVNVSFNASTATDALFALAGETQDDLATRLGVSTGTVANSRRGGCSVRTAWALKGAWGLDADGDASGEMLLALLTSGRPVRIRSIEFEVVSEDEASDAQ